MIVVAGPGNCGTSYLIRVIHALGFDTGGHREIFREVPDEIDREGPAFNWPEAIKGTGTLCHGLKKKADLYGWDVSHIFVCYRQLAPMVESRVAMRPGRQYKDMTEEELRAAFERELPYTMGMLLHQVAFFDCSISLVKFPRSAEDIEYLCSILMPLGVTPEQVEAARNEVFDPTRIHQGG